MAFGDAQGVIVDLTRLFDPAEVWPDPEACPDWPIIAANNPDQFIRGRAAAEARLATHQAALGRGAQAMRAPAEEEAEALRLQYFAKYDSPVGPWTFVLGFRGWGIRDRGTENKARAIVDALHVRGYLRKLDERAARGKIQQERRRVEGAQAQVDRYESLKVSVAAELAELAEAEARHRQRIADEKAFERCLVLRSNLRDGYVEACRGASELGVETPQPPP